MSEHYALKASLGSGEAWLVQYSFDAHGKVGASWGARHERSVWTKQGAYAAGGSLLRDFPSLKIVRFHTSHKARLDRCAQAVHHAIRQNGTEHDIARAVIRAWTGKEVGA